MRFEYNIQFIIFSIFIILSIICFLTECYEIATSNRIIWSDYLHNMLDHYMFVIVNYIGFKIWSSS